MEVWAISFWDVGAETTFVESIWSTEEQAINYLKSHGGTCILDDWIWGIKDNQGDNFILTITKCCIDTEGWIGSIKHEL